MITDNARQTDSSVIMKRQRSCYMYTCMLGICTKQNRAATTNHMHTHTRLTALCPGPHVSRYHRGKTNLDFTEARDSEWQWHQVDHMQLCTSLQTGNHASTPPLSSLQAGCHSCRQTNSVKALKATTNHMHWQTNTHSPVSSVAHLLTCSLTAITERQTDICDVGRPDTHSHNTRNRL